MNQALYNVYEDMKFISEIYGSSESFRHFTENAGVGIREVRQINESLKQMGDIHDTTIRFIEVLAENKRLVYIQEVAEKYMKLY